MPPVFHDNHLMRFVPLIPSNLPPLPWRPFRAVELLWTGELQPQWLRDAPQVHAVHLPASPWTASLGVTVLEVLRQRLELDFLVLPAAAPSGLQATSGFLGVLEGLLEVTQGRGIKLALRPGPGQAQGLARLLKEARGEAVGFCWDGQTGADLDCFSDRLFCAVGAPADDFAPLQRLGYRWNLALRGQDPGALRQTIEGLEQAYPPVLFPADLETDLPQRQEHP